VHNTFNFFVDFVIFVAEYSRITFTAVASQKMATSVQLQSKLAQLDKVCIRFSIRDSFGLVLHQSWRTAISEVSVQTRS